MLRRSNGTLKASFERQHALATCPACARTSARPFSAAVQATSASPTASTSRLQPSASPLALVQPRRALPSRRGVATEAASHPDEGAVPEEQRDEDQHEPAAPQLEEMAPEITRAPGITTDKLRQRTVVQDHPTLADLDARVPTGRRYFEIPTRRSTPAARKQYADFWDATAHTIHSAFNQTQLAALLGKGTAEHPGMDINVHDPMLVHQMRGRGNKAWKPRSLSKLNKSELVRLALITRFGMADPKMLPSHKVGQLYSETVAITEKEGYLFSSEAHPIRRNIIDRLGVTPSLARSEVDPNKLSLVLEGDMQAVKAAAGNLEDIVALSFQREFEVPAPTATLPMALYSRISRMSRAFIEPLSDTSVDNVVAAFAVEQSSLKRVESLLARAFIHTSIQARTPIFAAIAASLEKVVYALTPFVSPLPHPWAVSSNSFTRIQRVSITRSGANSSGGRGSELDAAHDFLRWAEGRGLNRLRQVGVGKAAGSTVFKELGESIMGEGELEMTAKFGHVLWPALHGEKSALKGTWPFAKALPWLENQAASRIFLSSPPARFLEATTTFPTPPVAAVLWEEDAAPVAGLDLDAQPALSSRWLRRVVYRPVDLPAAGGSVVSIELELEYSEDLEDDMKDPEPLSKTLRKVSRSFADMVVPEGSADCQIALTRRTTLDLESFATLSDELAPLPLSIRHESRTYILDTDRSIRRTLVDPPVAPAVGARAGVAFVQERWSDRLEDRLRGVDVETVLGSGTAEPAALEKMWTDAQEEVLATCKVEYPRSEESLVFKAGR